MKRWWGLWLVVWLVSACNGSPPKAAEPSPPTLPGPDEAPEDDPPEGDAQPTLPKGTVVLETADGEPLTLSVEVASTPPQRQAGLMFRQSLGEDEGMLFAFAVPRTNSFWMRNTYIPLDIFFIDSEWTVVGIVENAEPLTDDPREVEAPSQYVLEVNAGLAKKHGFSAGTKVRFTPPEAK